MVLGGELIAIGPSGRFMLLLYSRRRDVRLVRKFLLLSRGARGDAASTAVETDVADVADHRLLVYVVDDVHIYIVHAAVVEKVSARPVATRVTVANIAEAVIDSTVEADLRTPVSGIEHVGAVTPTPVAGRPQQTDLWRFYPRTRNPVIPAIVGVTPVTRRPNVSIARTNRLRVNRQHGRCDVHRQRNLR